jgi:hypothetical protein
LLGEWLAEDLLEPDRVHPTFHPCHVLRRHSCEIGIRRPGLNAAIVTGASDGPVARFVLRRPARARGSGQGRSHFPQIARFWGRETFRCPQQRYAKSEDRPGSFGRWMREVCDGTPQRRRNRDPRAAPGRTFLYDVSPSAHVTGRPTGLCEMNFSRATQGGDALTGAAR